MPPARLELARPFSREILSLLCLPFHHGGMRRDCVPSLRIKTLPQGQVKISAPCNYRSRRYRTMAAYKMAEDMMKYTLTHRYC